MKQILLLLIFVPAVSYSAGYLEFNSQGTPYKWVGPVEYIVDQGNLSSGINNATGNTIVDGVFDAWEAVGGLTFSDSGATSVDLDETNWTTQVNFQGDNCPSSVDDKFLVLFDEDGAIFDNEFGVNSGILGIASPGGFNDAQMKITCAYALINGDAIGSDQDSAEYIMLHEFGHALNLEHSQINEDYQSDSLPTNDQHIPLMFPIIPNSLTFALAGGMGGIKLDDQYSFKYLYSQTNLLSQGRIRGQILDHKGDGVLGANVVCYDVLNPDENVVSWISDSVLDGGGEYQCGNLPDGNYNVRIEPVKYAINQWDEGIPPFVPTEYFNGENESSIASIDSLAEKTNVTVNGTTDDVNIILNDNGRITSKKKITATVDSLNVADLEYFIYVPSSADKVTFTLESSPSSSDLDIYGRCNSPFSLATSTAGPWYDPTSPSEQQAEFFGAGTTGNEEVVLDSSSTPEIDTCEYHLLIVNYSNSAADIELTATIEGPKPELRANFAADKDLQDNSETLVSRVIFQADGDQFTITSAKFTDTGIESISGVTKASLYSDDNNNGRVDAADTLLSSTSNINAADRSFTLANLNLFLDEDERDEYLLTYTMPTTSSSSNLVYVFGLFSLILIGLIRGDRKIRFTFSVLFLMFVLSRCSGSGDQDFNPVISEASDITAQASGFGEEFSLQVGKPSSVKDFFK